MPKVPRRAASIKLAANDPSRACPTAEVVGARPTSRKPPPLVVTLPDIPSVPEPWRGAKYVLRKLMSAGDDNPKLFKSNRAGTPYQTWGLALAPARSSGYSLCSSSSPGCRGSCLHFQGHARLDSGIVACRLARTVALKEHREWFEEQLLYELNVIARRAEHGGFKVALRLNLTSDVMWEREWPDLFWRFPNFVYYDYSKHFLRMMRYINGELPENYSLTFSRSEDNDLESHDVLTAGGNVAVVFRRQLPERWIGFRVIDGDEHDLRFLDERGVVIGLRAKGSGRGDESGFVVDVEGRRPLVVAREG